MNCYMKDPIFSKEPKSRFSRGAYTMQLHPLGVAGCTGHLDKNARELTPKQGPEPSDNSASSAPLVENLDCAPHHL